MLRQSQRITTMFDKTHETISISEIKNSIPENSYKTEQPQLQENNCEWRWRFIRINNKTYAEISYKLPNEERKYINNDGVWKSKETNDFDQYVVEQYYYYTQDNEGI